MNAVSTVRRTPLGGAPAYRVQTGKHVRAYANGPSSGDAVFTWSDGPRGLYALVDALGHGRDAERSAQLALEVLHRMAGAGLPEIFEQLHRAMTGVRGVVMSAISVHGSSVTFAGLGNVELMAPAGLSRPPCMAGVFGSGRLHVRTYGLEVTAPSRWGLVSDGIRQRDARSAWDQTATLNPDDAAWAVIELAARDEDDASVLVLDFARGDH